MKRYLLSILFTAAILLAGIQVTLAGGINGHGEGQRGERTAATPLSISIRSPVRRFPHRKEHARMDQKNLMFVPHVLPVLAGTTVDFMNSDDVLHNVFSPDKCCDKFNLGSWPKGQIEILHLQRAGMRRNLAVQCPS